MKLININSNIFYDKNGYNKNPDYIIYTLILK